MTIMAWRPTKHLIEGELDNTTPGKVTGWMRFSGMGELVSFDLRGDFHRDIRGARLRIRRRDALPSRRYMDGFVTLQAGDAGDITAGLPPHDYTQHPYIEWYGPNGRVVIEPAPDEVEVLGEPIPWDQTEPIDPGRQDELLAGFVASLAAALEREGGQPRETIVAVFHPGAMRFSDGVRAAFSFEEVLDGLRRHLTADWGDVDRRRWRENDRALKKGDGVLLSSYRGTEGQRCFILTRLGRGSTTVFLPQEAGLFLK
jgi:hypothetical protein